MPGPVTKKPSAVYTPPVSMRGVNALEGPEAVRQQFTDIVSTVLQDAAVEVGTYRDRLGRETESRFDQPPVAEEVIQYQESPELVGRHPPGMQEAELDVPAAETWNPWTPRGPQPVRPLGCIADLVRASSPPSAALRARLSVCPV